MQLWLYCMVGFWLFVLLASLVALRPFSGWFQHLIAMWAGALTHCLVDTLCVVATTVNIQQICVPGAGLGWTGHRQGLGCSLRYKNAILRRRDASFWRKQSFRVGEMNIWISRDLFSQGTNCLTTDLCPLAISCVPMFSCLSFVRYFISMILRATPTAAGPSGFLQSEIWKTCKTGRKAYQYTSRPALLCLFCLACLLVWEI